MRVKLGAAFVLVLVNVAVSWAAYPALLLNSNRLHLGITGKPEWEEFASKTPNAHRFDLNFRARSNATENTLLIHQNDVRHDWFVELNKRRLGKLFLMEADLVHTLAIPPGTLREGENLLSIVPPKETDDIFLHEITLIPEPAHLALREAGISVSVTEAGLGKPLPCRITVIDQHGALAPLQTLLTGADSAVNEAPTNLVLRSRNATRPGVVYTGTGQAHIGLRSGDYTIFASRGFEYGVSTQRFRLAAKEHRQFKMELRREVATPGLISCDTHVHTLTHSGHGDARMEERVLTLAGEGVELPIATEHNLHVDYSAAARQLGVAGYFTPVTGNEVTTAAGHFNVFPVRPSERVADFRITHWPTLMKVFRDTPGLAVVILNHPRNVHQGFQPFAATNYNPVTGENKRGPEFTFDAMEVMNSSAQQSDYMLVYRDWFALLNYGYRITGVGSSDGHDVSRYIVGQGRTYIACADSTPDRIDVAAACNNLRAGRAFVSMGLLVQMTLQERFGVGDFATNLPAQLRVAVTVLGPSWVDATNVQLFANGTKIRDEALIAQSGTGSISSGEKAHLAWTMPRPTHDIHLVAIATGPGVTAPFWAIPRPYQPTSPRWERRVIGSTNPIWVDADGDGQFTSARGYARQIVMRHGTEPAKVLPALQRFDETVAAQAASFCAAAGLRLDEDNFSEKLRIAAPHVQRGFEAYISTTK